MPKKDISLVITGIRNSMKKHSPEILTAVGIAGMVTATVLAVRATPKALILIEQKKEETNSDMLSPMDTIKAAGVCYIPAVMTGTFAVICLIGASSVNVRRNTALATAYRLSESALKEYQEKVIEAVGNRKERSIRDSVAKEKIASHPVSSHQIIATGKGATLCYDAISGRYFWSDIEKLRKAENEMNRRMMNDMPMYISLNDLYCEIGLPPIQIGDDLGWNLDKGLIDMEFSSQLTEDGTPCLVLGYHVAPEYGYE